MKKALNIAVRLLRDSQLTSARDKIAPDFETILQKIAKIQKNSRKIAIFCVNKLLKTYAILKGGERIMIEILDDW